MLGLGAVFLSWVSHGEFIRTGCGLTAQHHTKNMQYSEHDQHRLDRSARSLSLLLNSSDRQKLLMSLMSVLHFGLDHLHKGLAVLVFPEKDHVDPGVPGLL